MDIIICGAGQVGFSLASYLADNDCNVTIIDNNAEMIEKVNERLDVKSIRGHASHPEVLAKAGAKNAEMIIAVTHSDEVNMVACEAAKALFDIPKKIARIRSQSYLHRDWENLFTPNNLNIDNVISPEREVASAISRSFNIPGAFDMIPLCNDKVKIIGIRIIAQTPIVNTPISHITGLYPELNITIIGLIRGDEKMIPHASEVLQEGDEVYYAVADEHVGLSVSAFGYESLDSSKILICGGGNIGLFLAQSIEKEHPTIKAQIIEKNRDRARFIAQKLKDTIILCGDALESEVLKEASVHRCETVISVTEDDRANTLSALLAKRLGARRGLSLINNTSFSSLVTSLGVDAVISPRVVTVSRILQSIRKGQVKNIYSLGEGFGEIIEAEASQTSRLVGSSVGQINKPGKLMVAALYRRETVIIPTDNTVVKLEDRVVLMVATEMVQEVENYFSARLAYYS